MCGAPAKYRTPQAQRTGRAQRPVLCMSGWSSRRSRQLVACFPGTGREVDLTRACPRARKPERSDPAAVWSTPESSAAEVTRPNLSTFLQLIPCGALVAERSPAQRGWGASAAHRPRQCRGARDGRSASVGSGRPRGRPRTPYRRVMFPSVHSVLPAKSVGTARASAQRTFRVPTWSGATGSPDATGDHSPVTITPSCFQPDPDFLVAPTIPAAGRA